MDDKEFQVLLAETEDCPETLIKLAETPFQKATAIEFFLLDKRMARYEANMAWMKKLSFAVFGVVVLSALAQYITPFFQTIFA